MCLGCVRAFVRARARASYVSCQIIKLVFFVYTFHRALFFNVVDDYRRGFACVAFSMLSMITAEVLHASWA